MPKKKNIKKFPKNETIQLSDSALVTKSQLLKFLANEKRPLGWIDISNGLGVQSKREKKSLSGHLSAMLKSGELLFNRKEQYCLVQQSDLEAGVVIGHADGFGFLKRDAGGDDMFIPPHEMRALMNGDRVVASRGKLNRQGKIEARIVDVLERKVKTVVGRFFNEGGIFHVEAENKRIFQHIFVPADATLNAKGGQIVMVEITHYPSSRTQAIAKVIEVMGDHMAPGMEIDMAIRSHELPNIWSQDVLDEAQGFGSGVTEDDLEDRKDVRKLPFVTIDGADARDFDDAVYCKKMAKGWKLCVAIADVSHYVKPGSAIDVEAYERGTSVYFPEQVIPMLPEVLSNGLCSLNPLVDRLCMVCEMRLDDTGEVTASKFYQAVMHSHARLTYDEVGAIFDETEPELTKKHKKLLPHLQALKGLYEVMKVAANERGALEFDTFETRFVFDEKRKIKGIEPVIRHDAHRLIEVFMIAANASTASFLVKHEMPNLLRIHDGPSIDRLLKLRGFLSELGLSLDGGDEPKPHHYKQLISSIQDRPDAHLIETVMLRSMSQAMYSPEQQGHFGLALDLYAHFTSPIRRYPDLLTHRAIKHVLQKKKAKSFNYSNADMETFGEHCSYCSRRADEATREVESWLKCEFMLDKIGQEFIGVVSSVTSFGLFVELDKVFIDGLVHVTALGDDYYHFDAGKHRLLGERTNKSFRLGDRLKVTVVKVSLEDKKIDLSLAGAKQTEKVAKKRFKKKRR
ncbi:MAG: ribonuclease R [Cycloclasticus sp. symbiont of Bathymodiolus heckerae]|nr:MAG: ribonuclease R [Cycloclasticus sp. symbiont of Bathymodiolus heckerae]